MLLARSAREHGDAAHAAARVREQMPEPGPHRLAHEVLSCDRERAALPSVADGSQKRAQHLHQRCVDAEERERLVDPQADLGRFRTPERMKNSAQVIARRARRLDSDRAEQRGCLADPVALPEPFAQPLDAGDVALGVAALPARSARGLEDLVALLPLPERLGRHTRAVRERRDGVPSRHRPR